MPRFFLTFFSSLAIMSAAQKQIRLRGAGQIRLRVSCVALTREPDTANTVGGKDADLNTAKTVLHCTWTGLRCNFIFGGILLCKRKQNV